MSCRPSLRLCVNCFFQRALPQRTKKEAALAGGFVKTILNVAYLRRRKFISATAPKLASANTEGSGITSKASPLNP